MDSICKNCDTVFSDRYNYCPNCSQKSRLHRLTFHDVWHEAIHYFTHADKGFLQLIRDLFRKRGKVAFEYIEGRRKKYFPPLNFFLIIAAIFVFVATLKESSAPFDVLKAHPELNQIQDTAKQHHLIAVYERKENVRHFTDKYSNLMAMCSLPLTAVVFWLFYQKSKYNFVEHLVAGMYMLGFCILIYALLILPVTYVFGFSRDWAILPFFVVQIVYFSIFYHGFLNKTSALAFAKAFCASVCSLLLWIIVSTTVIRFYIASGFGGLLH